LDEQSLRFPCIAHYFESHLNSCVNAYTHPMRILLMLLGRGYQDIAYIWALNCGALGYLGTRVSAVEVGAFVVSIDASAFTTILTLRTWIKMTGTTSYQLACNQSYVSRVDINLSL